MGGTLNCAYLPCKIGYFRATEEVILGAMYGPFSFLDPFWGLIIIFSIASGFQASENSSGNGLSRTKWPSCLFIYPKEGRIRRANIRDSSAVAPFSSAVLTHQKEQSSF